jgi:hypothetical protein
LRVLRAKVRSGKLRDQDGHTHGPTEVDLGLLACDGVEEKVKELGWNGDD